MYKLYYGDGVLYDPFTSDTVYDGKLTAKSNTADYLDFTVPYGHRLYGTIAERGEDVSLYWDETCLFRGTIESIETDIEGAKAVSCNGALTWLEDTLLRPYSTVAGEQPLTAPSAADGLFSWYISQHNERTLDTSHRFAVGVNQGAQLDANNYVYRASEQLPTVWDEIDSKLVDSLGGYVSVDYTDPMRVNWYADVHDTNAQVIDFGVNITNFTKTVDTSDQYTAVRAKGATPTVHVKFSAVQSPSADDMTDEPSTFIGTYCDCETNDSKEPSAYAWRYWGGDTTDGISATMSDGYTCYLHVAWAQSSDGRASFSTDNSRGATYIGQYVDFEKADSGDYRSYSWEALKQGDEGSGKSGPYTDSAAQALTVEPAPDGGTSDSGVNKKLDVVYSVSKGSRYGYREYAYSDTACTTVSGLLASAITKLRALDQPTTSVTVKAVDLALYMDGYDHLRVGQAVRVRSKLHDTDEYLMVQSITLDLDEPSNTEYELGAEYSTLTGQQSAYLKSQTANINAALDTATASSAEAKAAAKDAQEAQQQAEDAAAAAESSIVSIVYQYATSAEPTTVPGADDWSTDAPDYSAAKYIWTRTITTNGKGETATSPAVIVTGNQGIPGKGRDGKTAYVHIAYANSADGKTDFDVADPTGRSYIGQYTDNSADDSTDPTAYTWSLIKGEDGVSPTAKVEQTNTGATITVTDKSGTTSTTVNNGSDGYSPTVQTSKTGTLTQIIITDKDGSHFANINDGAAGKGISSATVQYAKSTSGTTAPTSGWQSSIPTVEKGSYLWTKTTTSYTSGNPTTSYSVAYIAEDGTSTTIKSATTTYQAGTSATAIPTGTWQEISKVTVPQGGYLWSKTVVTYSDGTSTNAYGVSYSAKDGADGAGFAWNLLPGTSTAAGWSEYNSFDKTTRTFTRTTSATSECFVKYYGASVTVGETYTLSADIWSNGYVKSVDMFCFGRSVKKPLSRTITPTTTATRYTLTFTVPEVSGEDWSLSTIRFDNNGSKTSGTAASLYVRDIKLEKGSTASPWCTTQAETIGSDGASVSAVKIQYYKSTSSSTQTGGNWQDSVPDWEKGKYIWQRTQTTIGGKTVTGTPVLYGAFNSLATSVEGNSSKISQTANALGLTFGTSKATGTLIKADSTGIELGQSTDGSSFASTHTKMGTSAFYIHDKSHNELASFGSDTVELGKNSSSAVIKMCNDKVRVTSETSTYDGMSFTTGYIESGGADAIGISADKADSGYPIRRANATASVDPTMGSYPRFDANVMYNHNGSSLGYVNYATVDMVADKTSATAYLAANNAKVSGYEPYLGLKAAYDSSTTPPTSTSTVTINGNTLSVNGTSASMNRLKALLSAPKLLWSGTWTSGSITVDGTGFSIFAAKVSGWGDSAIFGALVGGQMTMQLADVWANGDKNSMAMAAVRVKVSGTTWTMVAGNRINYGTGYSYGFGGVTAIYGIG